MIMNFYSFDIKRATIILPLMGSYSINDDLAVIFSKNPSPFRWSSSSFGGPKYNRICPDDRVSDEKIKIASLHIPCSLTGRKMSK